MTLRELAGESTLRARRRLARALRRASDSSRETYISESDLRRSVGGNSIGAFAHRMRANLELPLLPGLADLADTTAAVKTLSPQSIVQSRIDAEAILDHRIKLFGREAGLMPEIDWHRDPYGDARWPVSHYTRVPLVIGKGADVRVLWELNRLHHLVALGRAYLLTNDERYTDEFLAQLASWYQTNPPRFGVNWTNAMEAGIRAVNVITALQMFRGSQKLTDQAFELILKMLLAHGRFIRANLEFSYRTPSNHFLSDLIGLFAIGTTAPEFRDARGWRDFSARRLVTEMNRQVLADGVDYELSVGYHRFVLEIFALFYSLCPEANFDPGKAFQERLESMFEFVRCYLKPDHTAPAIGDSDDGRLVRFKDRPAADHSYLMSIGAVLFRSGRFKLSSEIDEEAIWWFGKSSVDTFERLPINGLDPGSRGFPRAQIFVQRAGGLYSIVDCGDHGARGRGSHAHSDALSIEISAFNRTFIRDPGTYVYTASEEQRNLFRSTAYHNTVRVDGEEISSVNPGDLFAFAENVRPHMNQWESTPERDLLDAEHYAYRRLASPVTHRRLVEFDKREGYWIIRDIFTGEGLHRFEFFFNLDVGLEAQIGGNEGVVVRDQESAVAIMPVSKPSLETELTERWVSTSYSARIQSSGIIFRLSSQVPFENVVLVIPYRLGAEERRESVLASYLASTHRNPSTDL